MSFEFLSAGGGAVSEDARFTPVARSPMESAARAAGARTETRDGWSVVVDYGAPDAEAQACRETAAWVDVSHLGKIEVQAAASELPGIAAAAGEGVELELGRAVRSRGAWWCPLTATRLLVICEPEAVSGLLARLREAGDGSASPVSVTEVSTVFGALTLVGPAVREVFARFCALDLRPEVTPVSALRPGSVARQPGIVLREAPHRYLVLFGWAVGEYMWTVVADAAAHLGGRAAGVSALDPLAEPILETAGEGSGA